MGFKKGLMSSTFLLKYLAFVYVGTKEVYLLFMCLPLPGDSGLGGVGLIGDR